MSNIDKRSLREAAEKFRATFAAHRQSPKNYEALDAWDRATNEFFALVNNDELNIIASLLDELEAAEKRIAELTEKPIGWTDEQELRDVEKLGCGYLFNANPITLHADPRRVILLYAAAAGKGE